MAGQQLQYQTDCHSSWYDVDDFDRNAPGKYRLINRPREWWIVLTKDGSLAEVTNKNPCFVPEGYELILVRETQQ